MIEFETKPRDRWVKRTVNPDVIADAILGEDKLTLFYTANKRGVASEYLNREQIKPSLEEIWGQINGKPKSKIISFEVINEGEDSRFKNTKIHLEPDSISGFLLTKKDGLSIIFYGDTKQDLALRQGDTIESLEEIYQQLCKAKGIEIEKPSEVSNKQALDYITQKAKQLRDKRQSEEATE